VAVLACDRNGPLVDDAARPWRASRRVRARRGLPGQGLSAFLDGFRLPLGAFFEDRGVDRGDLSCAGTEWNAAVPAEPALPMPGLPPMLGLLEGTGVEVGPREAYPTI